ncbi:hypothetical protein MNBD_UNCLBAC01-209 [hydrothermal vent metagenome]|uniref:Peptidase A2 domain-containing protein n=1 Tax=hydrothermal vent metagenome TaxID=652676 RepID=A0A3B1D4U4_9ZZZZ
MIKKILIFSTCIIGMFVLQGCSAMRTTGRVAKGVGKVGWTTAKITGKVVMVTGKTAIKTGKVTHKGVRTVVYIARGKQIIPLYREGNSFYAKVKLNRKLRAKLLVDTGAESVQISRAMAKRLRINLDKGEPIMARLAGGTVVSGRVVNIKEIQMGSVKVRNVRAIVLDQDRMEMSEGLLGMSFLNNFIFEMDTKRSQLILQQRVVEGDR